MKIYGKAYRILKPTKRSFCSPKKSFIKRNRTLKLGLGDLKLNLIGLGNHEFSCKLKDSS